MRKALIEKASNRICQVEPLNPDHERGEPFPVHEGLEWHNCEDDVMPDTHVFDGASFAAKPPPPPPSQEELERQARREALDAEALADAFIDRLRSASPDEIKTYVQNNVTDLASAKLFIAKLACAVAYALNGGTAK